MPARRVKQKQSAACVDSYLSRDGLLSFHTMHLRPARAGVGAPLVDEGQVVALQRAAQAAHVVARGGLLNRARACIGACSSRHRVNLQLFSLDTLRYTEL